VDKVSLVRGKTARATAALIVLSLILSGCSLLSAFRGNSIAQYRVPMTKALQTFYTQKLQWTSCGEPYECASAQVPLDWAHPGGEQIVIALIKHPATGDRIGSLLVNPGGPGGSGVELVGAGVEYAVDSAVAERYDVIGFDPRGVGQSTAVDCGGSEGLDKFLYGTVDGEIGSAEWIDGQQAKAKAFAQACEDGTGDLLAHVDTVTAARDLDIIRAAVGDKQLNFLGYSYGTELGTIYAGLYPKNVGRFVFDGPDNPWYGSSGGDDSQAASFDSALDSFLLSCLSNTPEAIGDGTCPFTGSFVQAKKAVTGLLDAAREDPIQNPDGRELNAATLATAISEPLYDATAWPELSAMFREVETGKSDAAFELADKYNARGTDGQYYDNLNEAYLAINCLEFGHSIDLKYDAMELKQLKKSAPILGAYVGYADLSCSGWSYGPTSFPDPIRATGAGPILLVGTTGDPATPYDGAKALAKQLDSGHFVTFNGEGHTAYNYGHACVDKAVDDYLISGIVPTTDPDCS
jgi:pimeloyl-ACP methyl ester carboxylesterase